MNFNWDEDDIGDDINSNLFGFENDHYDPDIFSDDLMNSNPNDSNSANFSNTITSDSEREHSHQICDSSPAQIHNIHNQFGPRMNSQQPYQTAPNGAYYNMLGHSQPSLRFRSRKKAPQFPISLIPMLSSKIDLSEKFTTRKSNRKIDLWVSSTPSAARTDQLFNDILIKRNVTLNPLRMGFIPSYFWVDKEVPLVDLVYDFFQRKNHANCRFFHKLYNALRMGSISDIYAEIAGVQWITDTVFKVNKGQFARLLGIKAIEGSLFHQQGNFPTHGFVELNIQQAKILCPAYNLNLIDFDDVRLMIHQPGIFTRTCNEAQLMTCAPLSFRKNRPK